MFYNNNHFMQASFMHSSLASGQSMQSLSDAKLCYNEDMLHRGLLGNRYLSASKLNRRKISWQRFMLDSERIRSIASVTWFRMQIKKIIIYFYENVRKFSALISVKGCRLTPTSLGCFDSRLNNWKWIKVKLSVLPNVWGSEGIA
jgi:hypothetical protein